MSEVDDGWDEPDPAPEQDPAEAPELVYPSLEEWFSDFLVELYFRDLGHGSRLWCPQWWLHAEAVYRLDALWRSWEHLRRDGALGPSIWLRDHLDPHMTQLMAPDGPFKGCDPERGHRRRQAAQLPGTPPAGLFQPLNPVTETATRPTSSPTDTSKGTAAREGDN